MNKRRFIAVFIVLCLMLTVGCAESSSQEGATSGPGQEEVATTGSGQEEDTSDVVVEETKGRPVIEIATMITRETNEDNTTVYVEGSHDRVSLSKDSKEQYKELSDALDRINEEKTKAYKEQVEKYRQDRIENPENAMGEDVPNRDTDKSYVRRCDEQVLSVLESNYQYAGGAHGGTEYSAFNLDAQTGQEIKLSDVIADQDLLVKTLEEELLKKYGKDIFFEGLGDSLRDIIQEKDGMRPSWTLDAQGITFYFGAYEIASYAAGLQNVTLLYSAQESLFTDQYRPVEGEGYITKIEEYNTSSVDVDGDGEAETVEVYYERSEEDNNTIEGAEIVVNKKSTKVNDLYCFDANSYVVYSSTGKTFLYIWVTSENDWMSLHMFDISSGKPESRGTLDVNHYAEVDDTDEDYSVFRNEITDPDHMVLTTRFDILSTYYAKKTYAVKDNPLPETTDPYYIVNSNITLVSKAKVTGDLVDEAGNIQEESVEMPSGTSFHLYRTDGKHIVDTTLEDGRIFRITVEGDYPPYVNGVDANELFEQLFYAG